jgi:hypothetical protein
MTREEILEKSNGILKEKLQISEQAGRLMDIELNIVHDCLMRLYNGHDDNVPIIRECLDEIKKKCKQP